MPILICFRKIGHSFSFQDEVGYLKSLGMARTNEVMRDARIGEAEALMESKVTSHTKHGLV